MIKSKKVFIITVDDCARPSVPLDGKRRNIPFEAYECVLKLAKKYRIKIRLAVISRFIDLCNVSGIGAPVSYAEDLIELVNKNQGYLEVCYHGFTHSYKYSKERELADQWPPNAGEFYKLDLDERVPYEIQLDHVRKSHLIFQSIGWKFPEIFVPPSHAWERDVTDKIIRSFQGKYIFSEPRFKINNKWFDFGRKSKYLIFLPRKSLGLRHNEINLAKRLNQVKRKILLDAVKSYFGSLRENLRFLDYVTHIANFMPENFPFWDELFEWVRGNLLMHLGKDSEEAIRYYMHLTSGRSAV